MVLYRIMQWPQELLYEIKQLAPSVKYVVGIDEVGRGAIAGPMTLGVCAIKIDDIQDLETIINLDDSKKLTAVKRQTILGHISNSELVNTIVLGKYSISAGRIDRWGIRRSYIDLLCRVIKKHDPSETLFLLDYGIPTLSTMKHVKSFIKGDSRVPVIALASIYAKECRDRYMTTTVHKQFPTYGFDGHVGYGTKFHRSQIMTYGTCNQHRISWIKNRPPTPGVSGADERTL